jgi:hypothetical protein
MGFENRIGTDFENVAQRLLYNYIATHPGFHAVESDLATEAAQKQMYDFILDLFTALYHDPTLVGLSTDPDETEDRPYPGRTYKAEQKKYLEARKLRRKNEDKIESLFDDLLLLGELGRVERRTLVVDTASLQLNKRDLNKLLKNLTQLGLQCTSDGERISLRSETYPDLCVAWKLLARIAAAESNAYDARHRQELEDELAVHAAGSGANWRTTVYLRYLRQIKNRIFKRAMFDPQHDDTVEILADLVNDPDMYRQFLDSLVANGFTVASDWGSGLDVTNFIDLKVHKQFAGEGGGEPFTVGLQVRFESRYYNQLSYIFADDKSMFKALLPQLERLPANVQDLLVRSTGPCRACGFCNQTNRKLPFKSIPVVYNGEELELCYFFKKIESRQLTTDMLADVQDLYGWIDQHYH